MLENDALPLEYKLRYGVATEQLSLTDIVDPSILRELGISDFFEELEKKLESSRNSLDNGV